jgi:hypothetical protein
MEQIMRLTVELPDAVYSNFEIAFRSNKESAEIAINRIVRTYIAEVFAQLSRQYKDERWEPKQSLDDSQSNPAVTEPVFWGGQSIETRKREPESFQDFVKRTLNFLLDNDLIPPEEIDLLQTKQYTRKTLGLEYPLIETNSARTKDGSGRPRYWSKMFSGKYFICSQWWRQKMDIHEPCFAAWIKHIITLNNIKGKRGHHEQ